jgi:hypothetical protein
MFYFSFLYLSSNLVVYQTAQGVGGEASGKEAIGET